MSPKDDQQPVFPFIVVHDPADEQSYSISMRYVMKTKGLAEVMDNLIKNAKRRRNAHKKHVEGTLCYHTASSVKCDLGEECRDIHVTSQYTDKRRVWHPKEKSTAVRTNDRGIAIPNAQCPHAAPYSAMSMPLCPQPHCPHCFPVYYPVALAPWEYFFNYNGSFSPFLCSGHNTGCTSQIPYTRMSSPAHFFQNNVSTQSIDFALHSLDDISPATVHDCFPCHPSVSPTWIQSPGYSPENSTTHSPPTRGALLNDIQRSTHHVPLANPAVMPPIPSCIYVHSPYALTPTQIYEDAAVSHCSSCNSLSWANTSSTDTVDLLCSDEYAI